MSITRVSNSPSATATTSKSLDRSSTTEPLIGPSAAALKLFAILGQPISPDLLVEALTHRSFAHEHPGTSHYERLEFLGDAVLELVVTETLYAKFPNHSEGQMAKIRAKTVSEESLAPIARDILHVGPMLLLGRGESDNGGADKDSILCDIVESLIGAVFIEHGIDAARQTVHALIDDTLEKASTQGPSLDWKTSLTVKARELGLAEPTYRMEVSGPDYSQQFTAQVIFEDTDAAHQLGIDTSQPLCTGTGSSKRKAQLAAAQVGWHKLEELGARNDK